MIKIVYSLTSYEEFFEKFSKSLGVKVSGHNEIQFTSGRGLGYCKLITLSNGLPVIVSDYKIERSIFFHRKKSKEENYVLRLEQTDTDTGPSSTIYFGKTNQEWYHVSAANIAVKNFDVIISRKWLRRYFHYEEPKNVILNYFRLKTPLVIFDEMSSDVKLLFSEIFNSDAKQQLGDFAVQNRINLIIEKFLYQLLKSVQSEFPSINMPAAEFRAIQSVAKMLVSDFTQKPPPISALSIQAAMSASKLQLLFKRIYGCPINQFYQKERMLKAKSMLLSKKYSVIEVAESLGFVSSTALKKAYLKIYRDFPSTL